MTIDAAEVFAQVNGALLIAIAVESGLLGSKPEDERYRKDRALRYPYATIAVLVSLIMTLMSIMYKKDLGFWAGQVAGAGTYLGVVLFAVQVIEKTMDEVASRRRVLFLIVAISVFLVVGLWAFKFNPSFD